MTDSLRDRIAAVLLPDLEYAAAYNPTGESPEAQAAALADAVIAELQPELDRHNTGCVCDECWCDQDMSIAVDSEGNVNDE